MRLTKEQLARIQNRRGQASDFDDLLDTIDALEAEKAAEVEAALRRVADECMENARDCEREGQTDCWPAHTVDRNSCLALIPEGNHLARHDVEVHKQGFNAGFDGAERAAFAREKELIERHAHAEREARRDEAERMYGILALTDAPEEFRLKEARKRMADNGSPQWITFRDALDPAPQPKEEE